jgi:hypothetical protein
MPARADRAEPAEAPRRWRRTGTAAVAVIALAAGLGGAAAIWVRHDGGASGSRESRQAAGQPQPERAPEMATGEGAEKTTARTSNRGVAGQRYLKITSRARRKARDGFGARSRARTPTLRRLRPAAFHVPGAPKEPLDEIALPARARRLDAWLTPGRGASAANQRHWLYQHAWIVAGANFGWWHGAEALRVLIRVDRRIESQWGIGHRSEAATRRALAALEARAK